MFAISVPASYSSIYWLACLYYIIGILSEAHIEGNNVEKLAVEKTVVAINIYYNGNQSTKEELDDIDYYQRQLYYPASLDTEQQQPAQYEEENASAW